MKPRETRHQIGNRIYVTTDSGILSSFEPARHSKPESVFSRIETTVRRFVEWINPNSTSQQGSAAASPSTYYQSLWAQRYERAAMVADCRRLYLQDTRVFKSINLYAAEATRGGVQIRVDGDHEMAKKAKKIAKKVLRLMPDATLESWARLLMLEGDLFIQNVVDFQDKHIVRLMRMPAAGIERLSNDADDFEDPMRAFSQVDTVTWQDVNVNAWPQVVMAHVRWLHCDGDRYGTPEIVACRRAFRMLDLVEASQTVRRMGRASNSRLWNIGDKNKPGNSAQVLAFQNENGMLKGNREPFDAMESVRDFFGNGTISCTSLDGDPNIHEVADLKYLQNVACVGLPTPMGIMGLDTEAINRDVLEDERDQWLKDTYRMTQALDQVVNHVFRLYLMLQGIDPEYVDWTTVWSHSSVEKEADRITSIIATKEAGLLSRETAMANLAEYFGVEDVEQEAARIDEEHKSGSDPIQAAKQSELEAKTQKLGLTEKDAYDLSLLHDLP